MYDILKIRILFSIHVWQFDPVYWGLHKQTYPPLLKVWQVPPFKQGLGEHGLVVTGVKHCEPDHPPFKILN